MKSGDLEAGGKMECEAMDSVALATRCKLLQEYVTGALIEVGRARRVPSQIKAEELVGVAMGAPDTGVAPFVPIYPAPDETGAQSPGCAEGDPRGYTSHMGVSEAEHEALRHSKSSKFYGDT